MALPMRAASPHETQDAMADQCARDERRAYPRGRFLPVRRPEPPPLRFPIPDVEILPQPWRTSPWLERGIYHGFRSDDVRPVKFMYEESEDYFCRTDEIVWVAVDSNGREVAFARWGNWDKERGEPRELTCERRTAVCTAMLDLLDEIDPVDDERPDIEFHSDDVEPKFVRSYPHVAPEHRRMLDADELMAPGLHLAPFRSASGRPVIVVIDAEWRLRTVVEIAPIGSPFRVTAFKGTFREREPQQWHPFDVYRRANEESLDVFPPGIHIAPWLPTDGVYTRRGAVDLVALDRHSRLVSVVTAMGPGDGTTRQEAERMLRKSLAEADPIYRNDELRDDLGSALDNIYDHIDRWQFERPDPATGAPEAGI